MTQGDTENRRRRPKQTRSRALYDAVVEAGAQLLVTEGPTTTTNRIAERAGVSVGSVYQYFGDKQGIFEAVGERHLERLDALHDQLMATLGSLPLHEALPAAIRGIIAFERLDPALGSALNRFLPFNRGFVPLLAFESRVEESLAGYLRARLPHGDVRPSDPVLVAKILVRALSGVIRETLATEPELVEDARFQAELMALVAGYLRVTSSS